MTHWTGTHTRLVHLSIVLIVASVGFFSFYWSGVRFGWHPAGWRQMGSKNTLTAAIETCFTGNDYERTKFMVCAQKKIVHDIQRWGTNALMRALADRLGSETSNRNITQCHDLAHAIGWAGSVATKNLKLVLPACTNTCVYGCQHGAVSAWYGMGKNITDSLPTLCTDGIDWSGNPQGQGGCFHELGHAMASVARYDIHASLKYCDKVEAKGRVDCAAGVFMEMFEAATFASMPLPLPANHPAWCGELWSPYKEYCWDQAGANEYGSHQDDIRAFAVCQKVPPENQANCFQNLGQNIFYVYQHEPHHLQAVEAFCRRAGTTWFLPCITGALSSSIAVEPTVSSGISLCRQLSRGEIEKCFGLLGQVLGVRRTAQEKTNICNGLMPIERRFCLTL